MKEVKMKGLKKAERAYLCVSLPLIIAIALLMNVNFAKAADGDSINADQLNPIRSISLLQGQSATLRFSQSAPFGSNSVAVTSIGNNIASATIGTISAPGNLPFPLGFHIAFIIGTGGRTFADMAVGLIPWGGVAATIDIGPPVSFVLVTSSLYVISDVPPSPSDPVTYNLTVR